MEPAGQIIVAAPAARLDRWLAGQAEPRASRARWQRAIAAGHVLVNGTPARPDAALEAGDRVDYRLPESAPPPHLAAEDIGLEVLFEDENLICLNKPPGLVVHPGAGHREGTLVNALLHHCRDLSGRDPARPGIVHRLDKDTSGCILVAKTDAAHEHLAGQFAARTAEKTYLAIVRGIPRASQGVVNKPIARHPVHRQRMSVSDRPEARAAETMWRVLVREGRLALVECRPRTGRTHQIRVHLKHLGHPIAGDRVYGGGADFPRQLLHAWKIRVAHPATGEPLAFCAPVPPDFPLAPPAPGG